MTSRNGTLFQLRGNNKFLLLRIVAKVKKIGFATNLAVFHTGLSTPGGFVHGRMIPLTAARALECRFHGAIVFLICNSRTIGNWKSANGD
jgi:hypothetical protein